MADSPLQKAPLGLLAAFDLKVLGQNPDLFGGVVSPVVDVTDFYFLTQSITQIATAAVSAIGAAVRMTVPAGEMWLVYAAAAELALSGTATTPSGLSIVLTMSPNSNARSCPIASFFDPRTAALPAALGVYAPWGGRRLIGPGGYLEGTLAGAVGIAPATLNVHAQYARILL